ncbi:hypothetical protein Btru_003294 [Bulinus truncatus]|nr:hypothetical protein Btru_003294 [Bulinus truncatus]
MDYRGGGRSRYSQDGYGHFQGQGHNDGRFNQTQRSGSYNEYPAPANTYGSGYSPNDFYPKINNPTTVPHSAMPISSGSGFSTSNISASTVQENAPDNYGGTYNSRQFSQRQGTSYNYQNFDNRPDLPDAQKSRYDELSDSRKGESSYRNMHFREEFNRKSDSENVRDYSHYKDRSKGEKDDRTSQKSAEDKNSSDSLSDINIYELLKDERLKNVLYAGISKATAKLEHSLKMNMGGENITFLETSKSSGAQLFPSASTDNKPKSILKRKGLADEDENSNDSFSKSSALEKTLQLLQNKTSSFDSAGAINKSSKQVTDALSQLSTYIDTEEDKLSQNNVSSKQSKETEGRQPFWSVNAVSSTSETSKRETDTFDIKEQLYEQWRQSIHRNDDAHRSSRKQKLSNVDPFFQKKIAEKIESSNSQNLMDPTKKEEEDLDTTVQNILQSIGFNFDLSKRMQELARQKKQQQDEFQSGIVDQSASFLDTDIFDDGLKASFLRADIKEPNLESLIKEVRASSQKSRNFEGGVISQERSKIDEKLSHDQYRRSSSRDNNRQLEEQLGSYEKWEYSSTNQTDKRAVPAYKGDERNASRRELRPRSRSYSRDRDSLSPPRGRYKAGRSDGDKYIEKLRDEPKDEYFYPDEGDNNKPPAVPLLTSFSSRRNEDLSSGLLTKLSSRNVHVENLQVTSCSIESSDEPFMESRRIILPAKQDKRISSKSPSYRGISPEAKRRRTVSPLSPLPKERKVGDYKERPRKDDYYDRLSDEKRSVSPNYHPRKKSRSPNYGSSPRRRYSPELKAGPYYRSPGRELSPKYNFTRSYQPSKYEDKFSKREKSPFKYSNDGKNVRNFSYNKKPERKRSYSPDYPRSSLRRRSRSPIYKSPNRRKSRSPQRYRRSPERFRSPLRDTRRSPYRKKSPLRVKPTEQKRTFEKEKHGKFPEKSDSSKTEKSELSSKSSEPLLADKSLEPSDKVDVSKLAPEERKAYLQKMLEKKQTVDEIKQGLLAAVERLGDISVDGRKQLLLKMSQATPAERQKIMNDLSQRQLKVNSLKLELNKLKKEQNELLRKSWRNGTAGKEPELLKNEEQQASIQEEILRLSTTDVDVPLNIPSSPPPSHLNKKENPIPVRKTVKPKVKAATAPAKKTATAQSSGQEGKIQALATTSKTTKAVADSVVDSVRIKQEKTNIKEEGEQKAHDAKEVSNRQKTYFEYYDSGNYWCVHCNAAANNLQQLYSHFHGKKHKNCIEKAKKPWKEVKKESMTTTRRVGVAQSRRVKGAEMMFPITGFYCTLCEVFCGDFADSTEHLKSDSHYNKYLVYVEKNPMYEKSLLLSKTAAKDPSSSSAGNKVKSKKKNLRVTCAGESDESENETVGLDIIDVVDMELDEDCVEQSQPKIPKLTAKLLPPITPMAPSTAVDMKETKEDRDKPLDKFLSIASTGHQGKKSQLPVVTKDSMDLSSIPIPEGPCLPDPERLSAKSKEEVVIVEQEDKTVEVSEAHTEESTPISLHDIPMPENTEGKKTKSLDTLFARLSKTVPTKSKPKPKLTTGATNPDMEKKIQEEIQAKLDREKQKLIRKKQKEEEKDKKVEEEQAPRKRYLSDSDSSSDESEVELPEDEKSEVDISQPVHPVIDNEMLVVAQDLSEQAKPDIDNEKSFVAQDPSNKTNTDINNETSVVVQGLSNQGHSVIDNEMSDTVVTQDLSQQALPEMDSEMSAVAHDLSQRANPFFNNETSGVVQDLSKQAPPDIEMSDTDLAQDQNISEILINIESHTNQVTCVHLAQTVLDDPDEVHLPAGLVDDQVLDHQAIPTEGDDQIKELQMADNAVDHQDKERVTKTVVDDQDNLDQVTETVDDLDSIAQAKETFNDLVILEQVTATVDDLDSVAQVTETVNVDQESEDKVIETVDDLDSAAQVTETVNVDLDSIAQVTETVNVDQESEDKVTETVDATDSVAQATENVNVDQESEDTVTETVNVDQERVDTVTETVDATDSIVQVTETGCANDTLDVNHHLSENFHGNNQEDGQQDEGYQWTGQTSDEDSQDATERFILLEPQEDDEDSNTLLFGDGVILSEGGEVNPQNPNKVEDCEKMASGMDDIELFTKKITVDKMSEADVISWDLVPEEGQTQSGQGKDPPMSGVVSEVEPVEADIVSVADDGDLDFEIENSPTEGLVLGLEDDDDMEFNIVMSNKQENGTDMGLENMFFCRYFLFSIFISFITIDSFFCH